MALVSAAAGVLLTVLVAAFSAHGGYGRSAPLTPAPDAPAPDAPALDESRLPQKGQCVVLNRVCVHQDVLVTHDWAYSFANPHRQPLPVLPEVPGWNFPAPIEANADALNGKMLGYRMYLRVASSNEPTSALEQPVFSNRTLPFLVSCEFPFNMGEFFQHAVQGVEALQLDPSVTLVVLLPMGLALAPFHRLLLMPYSRHAVISSAGLGERGCDDGSGKERPVPWSAEPSQPHCFERLLTCVPNSGPTRLMAASAARVVAALAERRLLPPSAAATSLRWGGGGGAQRGALSGALAEPKRGDPTEPTDLDADPRDNTTLRVLIETRHGPVRNIKNVEELLAACAEQNEKGFSAGPFRRLACAATSFSGSGGHVGEEQFLANVAAVRSAHVLAVLHGAGAVNAWFMRQGSSAVVEIRPCRFGSHYAAWPDKYAAEQHEHNGDAIRFLAYNIEDPAQCMEGDFEAGIHNKTIDKHDVKPDHAYYARDQHVKIRPAQFVRFLRHVGSLLLDKAAYQARREEGRLHAYALDQGLLFAPLGVQDVDAYRASHARDVVRV